MHQSPEISKHDVTITSYVLTISVSFFFFTHAMWESPISPLPRLNDTLAFSCTVKLFPHLIFPLCLSEMGALCQALTNSIFLFLSRFSFLFVSRRH